VIFALNNFASIPIHINDLVAAINAGISIFRFAFAYISTFNARQKDGLRFSVSRRYVETLRNSLHACHEYGGPVTTANMLGCLFFCNDTLDFCAASNEHETGHD
jgi:hypothetical protein